MNIHEQRPMQPNPYEVSVQQLPDDRWIDASEGTLRRGEEQQKIVLLIPYLLPNIPGFEPNKHSPIKIDAVPFQMGQKNIVYRIDSENNSCIIILSRGGKKLNKETEGDFKGLQISRDALIANNIEPFVPQVFGITEREGVTGFSAEYLSSHSELVSFDVFHNLETMPDALFFINNNTESANVFNERITKTIHGQLDKEAEAEIIKDIDRLKYELATRLALIFKTANIMPIDICLAAGDFMIDPTEENFDPHLTTFRGGFWQTRKISEFMDWMTSLKATKKPNSAHIFNEGLTYSAIRRAEMILEHFKQNE